MVGTHNLLRRTGARGSYSSDFMHHPYRSFAAQA